MDKNALKKFLMDVGKKGYSEVGDKIALGNDGSKTILIEDGDWKIHDNFFGGEPYGGREVISYKGKPVWIMVYYGNVDEVVNTRDIYPFLRKALALQPEEFPVRGPKELTERDFKYENNWEGDLDEFKGSEKILKDGREVYKASYIGGFIDIRQD